MARSCSRTVSQTQTLEFCRHRRFTLQDHDKGAQVDPGVEFVVALAGNPPTAYQWEIVSALNPVVLELLGEECVPERENCIGCGGTFFFRFRAVGPGDADLRFVYRRPWEGKPVKEFQVRVHVLRSPGGDWSLGHGGWAG